MSEAIKSRIIELSKLVEHHRYLYYIEQPEISDLEFDSLFKELQDLEKGNPEYAHPDSPTQKVGALPKIEFKKVMHKIPMLSLDKVHSIEEIKDWTHKIEKSLQDLGEHNV